jgi:hypothetical protein
MSILSRKNKAAATPDVETLEKRVDAMMDPSQRDQAPELPKTEGAIDIFGDPSAKSKVPSTWLDEMTKTATAKAEPVPSAEIDDIATDRAVESIEKAAPKGDPIDASGKRDFTVPKRPVEKAGKLDFLKKKKVWIPLVVLILVFFGLPLTRYMLLGLFIKEPYTVAVTDSKTAVAVSGVQVTIGGVSGETDNAGKVTLSAPVGSRALTASKANFTSKSSTVFVGFTGSRKTSLALVATGRQVPVKVVNAITGKPVANAKITVGEASSQTSSQGTATIVLKGVTGSKTASITTDGYNDQSVTIDVGTDLQTFKISPVGKVYFLSNKSGHIDVMKSDLDGSNRETVLAGTGNEDTDSTSLLASRDWQYLVLKAKRDNGQAGLYLIDTSSDKATQFESGSNSISLIGWYGHTVLYDVVKTSTAAWQPGREAIKSYNAETAQLNQLDQNQAEGTSSSYGTEAFSDPHIVDNAIVYTVQWSASGGYDITAKNASVRGMQPNGSAKKDYQTFLQSSITTIQSVVDAPGDIYYAVTASADNKPTYYEYQNAGVTANTNLDATAFSKGYPTYLFSPSGTQTAWEEAAGASHLFVGDNSGKRQKQVGNMSGYTPYAWYGETYLIATRGTGALYIFSPTDKDSASNPLRLTDYFKPSQSYAGYGYGYGAF